MTPLSKTHKFLKRFKRNRSGLAWIWTMAVGTLFLTALVVWPLNVALTRLLENLNYTFTGADAFALQVITICTTYLLVFVVLFVVYKSLILSKAENQGGY